ncbi:hypothetical protein, partial [Citrobacter braakii]|uniref:hypothetical protein n=1 Tax=Citrobacter braakii TaxID=57706 RepID=UPI001981C0C8
LFSKSEVGLAWDQLLTQYPALTVTGPELSPHLEEREWLQTIGWLPDLTPFRTCLRLIEAEDSFGEWQLSVYLQDREDSDRLFHVEQGLDAPNG